MSETFSLIRCEISHIMCRKKKYGKDLKEVQALLGRTHCETNSWTGSSNGVAASTKSYVQYGFMIQFQTVFCFYMHAYPELALLPQINLNSLAPWIQNFVFLKPRILWILLHHRSCWRPLDSTTVCLIWFEASFPCWNILKHEKEVIFEFIKWNVWLPNFARS